MFLSFSCKLAYSFIKKRIQLVLLFLSRSNSFFLLYQTVIFLLLFCFLIEEAKSPLAYLTIFFNNKKYFTKKVAFFLMISENTYILLKFCFCHLKTLWLNRKHLQRKFFYVIQKNLLTVYETTSSWLYLVVNLHHPTARLTLIAFDFVMFFLSFEGVICR